MKKNISILLITGLLWACFSILIPKQGSTAPPVAKSEPANKLTEKSEKKKKPEEKVFPWDNGPNTIDVSKYPKEQQENYKIFEKKCQKCHVLSRPINAPYSASELEEYTKKMMKKPRSGVDEKSAAKIIEFFKYDSSVRKRERFWEKTKEQELKKSDTTIEKKEPSKEASPESSKKDE